MAKGTDFLVLGPVSCGDGGRAISQRRGGAEEGTALLGRQGVGRLADRTRGREGSGVERLVHQDGVQIVLKILKEGGNGYTGSAPLTPP